VRAIQITSFGGPEVLRPAQLDEPANGPGRRLVDVEAAGVNFADTHQVENTYLAPASLPMVPGAEVVGRRRTDGRRVVALLGGGGYAEVAAADPDATFEIPDDLDAGTALALVLQGTTAWHLLRTSTQLARGESVVVHAAAGGVGSLAVQLARRWGAGRVIATASTAEKRQLALSLGADAAVDVSSCPDAGAVRDVLLDANNGRGVDVVLEMTGGAVFDGSLAALAPFGRLAVYGAASRRQGSPVPPGALMGRSTSVVGFWLVDAVRRRSAGGLRPAMEELLSMTVTGVLHPVVGGHYPLEDAARAHTDLRSRGTRGKLVLDVRNRAAAAR
jgi:NADPH2:quinone reductase